MITIKPAVKLAILRSTALVCMLASAALAGDECRMFTDAQGRTFSGKVIGFDEQEELVTLKCEDGRTGKMPLSVFSEADQTYFRDWGVSNDFLHGLVITANLKSAEVSRKESGFSDMQKKVFDSIYEIGLRNKTATTFGKIKIEYCMFYRQGVRKDCTVHYAEGICFGKTAVESLAPHVTEGFKTKSVRLYAEGADYTVFGVSGVSDAEVRGIWLRIQIKLPSGGELLREYRTSNDDFWKWTPQSIGVGLNKGSNAYMMNPIK